MALTSVFRAAKDIYTHTAILLLSIIPSLRVYMSTRTCACVSSFLVLAVIYFDSCKSGSDETATRAVVRRSIDLTGMLSGAQHREIYF